MTDERRLPAPSATANITAFDCSSESGHLIAQLHALERRVAALEARLGPATGPTRRLGSNRSTRRSRSVHNRRQRGEFYVFRIPPAKEAA